MRLLAIFILFTLLGCDHHIHVSRNRGVIRISEFESKIENVTEVPWEVGKNREAEVSQGFIMRVGVPKITKEDQKALAEDYGIDSWLYQIEYKYRGRTQILGHLYLPFKSIIKTTDNFSVHVYYHAAAASSRFRKFHCPALGHRKKIKEYSLESLKGDESFFVNYKEYFPAKHYALDHYPIILSGGKELTGEYFVTIALYNHLDKKRYSEFVHMGNKVVISNEDEVKVNSCAGIREEFDPLPGSREMRIEDIRLR